MGNWANVSALLNGFGGAVVLALLAWFMRHFFRWPIGDRDPEPGDDGDDRHTALTLAELRGAVRAEMRGLETNQNRMSVELTEHRKEAAKGREENIAAAAKTDSQLRAMSSRLTSFDRRISALEKR